MGLTPVQERTLVELMAAREEPPVFPRHLPADLRSELERRLRAAVAALPQGQRLRATKSRLTRLLLQCEGLFAADHAGEARFRHSERSAVGSLVHRAVEVGVHAPDVPPGRLVERALGTLRADERFRSFVMVQDEAQMALLRGEAVRRVELFRATFPPLEPAWTPVVEPVLKAPLAGGRVVLWARPDLMLGGQDPVEPMRARRLILELKTGSERPEHDDDLRLYALAATLRLGVPPFRVATLLLEDGTWRAQDVTADLLETTVRRVGDACSRAAALVSGEAPRLRPGPWCGWCPRRERCPAVAEEQAGAAPRPEPNLPAGPSQPTLG